MKNSNRIIKFRAWDKKSGKMIKSFAHVGKNGRMYTIHHEGYEPDYEVMQFAGLTDKNGVEIYEGDIIGRQLVGGEIEVIGRVIFDNDFGAFCINYENGGWAYLGQHMVEEMNHRKEVIGNIFSNPELLKED